MSENKKSPPKFTSTKEAKELIEKYLEDSYEREVYRITKKRKRLMAFPQNKRNPWKYFVLTFAYSWIIWIPSVLDGIGIDLPFDVAGYATVAVVIGAFAP